MEVQKRSLDQEDIDTGKRAKSDNADSNQVALPWDVLGEILSYVPYKRANWLNCRLVCKKFLEICERIQDPSVNNNWAIRWASEHGKFNLVRKLLDDPRVKANNLSVIHRVADHGEAKLLKAILARPEVFQGSRAKQEIRILLENSITRGFPDVALVLIDDPRSPSEVGSHGLFASAVSNNQWKLVEYLVDHPKAGKNRKSPNHLLLDTIRKWEDRWLMVRTILKYTDADPSQLDRLEYEKMLEKGFFRSLRELAKHPNFVLPVECIKFFKGENVDLLKEIHQSGKLEDRQDNVFLSSVHFQYAASSRDLNIFKYFLHKTHPTEVKEIVEHKIWIWHHTTKEIVKEVLDYIGLFEKYSCKMAFKACAFGELEIAKGLMEDPRFKATPEQIKYLKDTIEMAENL